MTEEGSEGLHLHHHLGPRRERAMFATLGFFVGLAITRGITTWLHYHGAGANGQMSTAQRSSPPKIAIASMLSRPCRCQ